ncbi:MAG: DoxX family protein [Phycisphaeraceae bacterium]|nr:DoxX family protein [Phycisphaeraceae bacterium]
MVGHHIGQLFLRVGLAATFLVAGLSKVMEKSEFSGESAAILANMGVIKQATAPTPGGEANDEGGSTEPIAFQPGRSRQPAGGDPLEQPAATPEGEPEAPPATAPPAATPPESQPEIRSITPRQPAAEPEEGSEQGSTGATAGARYSADDFPTPVMLPRVYGIAVMLKQRAHPAADENGRVPMAIVPGWAADTKVPGLGMATPVVLAWAAALTEIIGGGMLLVGFMSRLWALGLVGVMSTAIWTVTIGPAMQTGKAFLGFLPSHSHIFAMTEHGYAYAHEFWQLALLCMAFAVMFAGPGALSIDGILFGGRDDDGGDAE